MSDGFLLLAGQHGFLFVQDSLFFAIFHDRIKNPAVTQIGTLSLDVPLPIVINLYKKPQSGVVLPLCGLYY